MAFIPHYKDTKIIIDYSCCQEIDVIANFAPRGKIKPLYFMVKDEYGNDCKTKVNGIKYTKNYNGYISYCCTYQVGNIQRECFLLYYIQEHLWVLKKEL